MKVVCWILLLFTFQSSLLAQIEDLLVERYYVADSLDATDTIGGGVEAGEVTYRVFIDLAPGTRLLEVFGDEGRPFVISSTRRFFNNIDGATFGYEIPKVSYESNTVALDSYITIGQNGFQGVRNFFGLPKFQDDDGSFIGGENNDGGSAMIEGGLLINQDSSAGIPITVADGMDTLNLQLNQWLSFGIVDFASGADSSIFGINAQDSFFESSQFVLRCEGVQGVNPDSNYVLIAQLTTAGEMSLRLNARVLSPGGDTLTYVGTNEQTSPSVIFAPYLVYPQVCGCTDPDYLEFSPDFACSQEGACLNPVVLGCTDTLACNYDALANMNVDALCCYPGFCQERDLEEVCPHLKGPTFDFEVYPNPTNDLVYIRVISGESSNLDIEIFNYHGVRVFSNSLASAPLNYSVTVNTGDFNSGIYYVKVSGLNSVQTSMLVKL